MAVKTAVYGCSVCYRNCLWCEWMHGNGFLQQYIWQTKNDTEFNCNEAFIVRQADIYTVTKPDPSLPAHINMHKRKIFSNQVDNLSVWRAVLMECVSGRSHVVAEVGQDDRHVQVTTQHILVLTTQASTQHIQTYIISTHHSTLIKCLQCTMI